MSVKMHKHIFDVHVHSNRLIYISLTITMQLVSK